eukprot:54319_1
MVPELFPHTLSMLLLILCVVTSVSTHAAQEIRATPNILFILADDLGWANVGYHNQNGEVKTPNIDYLVANGLELNRHYAHYICSPTRSSLHSGRLPIHCNLNNGGPWYNTFVGIPSNYTLLSEKLKYGANYTTHFIGKWHSGASLISQMPYKRGYDTSFGYLWGMNDYWNENYGQCNSVQTVDLWDSTQPANHSNNTLYEEFLFTQRLYQLLDTQSNPFFIFYAPHISHSPLQIPEQYLTEYEDDEYLCCNFSLRGVQPNPIYPGYNKSCSQFHCRSTYQSMVHLLDTIIGDVTHKLKANDLWNNTLIVFSSDNGGQLTLEETAANNFPLRGGKFSPFEGGIRVNAFVSGGYLPMSQRGKVTNEMMHITDWYSTLCNMLHVDTEDEKAKRAGLPRIDSMNMLDVIFGINRTSPRTEVLIDNMTLIQNNYKFINSTNVHFSFFGCKQNQICYASWGGKIWPNTSSMEHPIQNAVIDCSHGCLFDIGSDYTEHNNLIHDPEYRDVVLNMSQRLMELRATYYSNNERGYSLCPTNISTSCACYMSQTEYSGFWGPFRGP